MTRAVFDCVILVQAAGRPTGPAGACLQAVRDGRLELVVSPDILAEIRDVLTRPKVLRKFPALTPEAVEVFLAYLVGHATMLAATPKVFPLPRDPKDQPYIDLTGPLPGQPGQRPPGPDGRCRLPAAIPRTHRG